MTKPRSFAPFIAAVLLLLPVLYVGSYLALVVPGGLWGLGESAVYFRGHYRIAGAAMVFWPLEHIDRRVRPGAWHTMPEPWFSNP